MGVVGLVWGRVFVVGVRMGFVGRCPRGPKIETFRFFSNRSKHHAMRGNGVKRGLRVLSVSIRFPEGRSKTKLLSPKVGDINKEFGLPNGSVFSSFGA